MFFKFLDYNAGIAYGDAVGWNISHHDASGTDGAAFSYRHTGKNGHVASNPAVPADDNGLGPFLSRVAFFGSGVWQAV